MSYVSYWTLAELWLDGGLVLSCLSNEVTTKKFNLDIINSISKQIKAQLCWALHSHNLMLFHFTHFSMTTLNRQQGF